MSKISAKEEFPWLLDKVLVRRSFERAASSYDQTAYLQREIGGRLFEHLDPILLQPARVLDLGTGTGASLGELKRRFPRASILAMDLASTMLQQARSKQRWPWRRPAYVCADAEALPLATASVDLIFSSLTFQWCNDLGRLFSECARVLRPGGLILFSTFGPDTLTELRTSWEAVDGHSHVNRFVDMHDLGDAMTSSGFADVVMDREQIRVEYSELRFLLHELKAIGAHNVTRGRNRGLTGRARLRALSDHYEQFRSGGKLPARYEVVYGHAWRVESRREPAPVSELQGIPINLARQGKSP